jgi:predicted ArsR family transcriptional regulator
MPDTGSVGEDPVDRQLEALSSPTRRAAYRMLLEAGRPCAVTEVAERLAISPNMARRHLQALTEAELVDEHTERRTERGRPRRLYVGRRDALPGWGSEGALVTVARLLALIHRDDADPYEVGYRAASHERLTGEHPVDRLWLGLLVAGFEPSVPTETPGCITLCNCAVRSVAEVDPATVCTLHWGLIDGLLGRPHATALTIRPPRQAGCTIQLPASESAELARAWSG